MLAFVIIPDGAPNYSFWLYRVLPKRTSGEYDFLFPVWPNNFTLNQLWEPQNKYIYPLFSKKDLSFNPAQWAKIRDFLVSGCSLDSNLLEGENLYLNENSLISILHVRGKLASSPWPLGMWVYGFVSTGCLFSSSSPESLIHSPGTFHLFPYLCVPREKWFVLSFDIPSRELCVGEILLAIRQSWTAKHWKLNFRRSCM